jgi:hypothetical protein
MRRDYKKGTRRCRQVAHQKVILMAAWHWRGGALVRGRWFRQVRELSEVVVPPLVLHIEKEEW